MNLEGIALKLLLEESDRQKALEYFAGLRPEYFSNAFNVVLTSIQDFYSKNNVIPTLEQLQIFRSRDKKASAALSTLSLVKTDNVDPSFVLEELANQFAQNKALDMLDDALKTLTLKDRYELLDTLSTIPLTLSDLINGSANVYSPSTLSVFDPEGDTQRLATGICNDFDAEVGGMYRQDLFLLGGKRGSGKSLVCANLMYRQHLIGRPSIYFTIEMTAAETYRRFLGIKAGIPAIKLKMNTLDESDTMKLMGAAADMFVGGTELFEAELKHAESPDFRAFEARLQKLPEKPAGRPIIYDDRALKLSTIDNVVSIYKGLFGDDLFLVIVDYMNRVRLDGSTDMFDWKDQTKVADSLKLLGRKHDVCLVSPYQMDDNGVARFSKGILDAADVAILIRVGDKAEARIELEISKARSADDSKKYSAGIDWTNLRIDPRPVIIEEREEEKTSPKKSDELQSELTL